MKSTMNPFQFFSALLRRYIEQYHITDFKFQWLSSSIRVAFLASTGSQQLVLNLNDLLGRFTDQFWTNELAISNLTLAYSCSDKSLISDDARRYGVRTTGAAPDTRSIQNSTCLDGGMDIAKITRKPDKNGHENGKIFNDDVDDFGTKIEPRSHKENLENVNDEDEEIEKENNVEDIEKENNDEEIKKENKD
uniref:Uncharacterized protein n=1 Tax=Tanacetum cinerariifolium TaxID=118510 RepID=A0A6L2MSJ9_TANCI|nr:hypothetical protein [Tanacetum cinerariifolium]